MTCEDKKIDDVTLSCEPHCDYICDDPMEQQRIRFEEDWYAAQEVLGRLVVRTWPRVPKPWQGRFSSWQEYLMYLYKPVAKHYGIDPDRVLISFNRHYLPTLILRELNEKV